jgi:hypothetical protein
MELTKDQLESTKELFQSYIEQISQEEFDAHTDYFRFVQAKKERIAESLDCLQKLLDGALPIVESLASKQNMTVNEFTKTDPSYSEVESV